MTAHLDTSRAPLGVLAAQQLIDAVVELGDLAERHYLELKSTLDLSTKKDKEKIAKFILGAANRMPDVAASAFEGYAAMIIGVGPGKITGIPPVEMMEISRVIQQYVGAAGPRWDVLWVPVQESTSQVLVILVNPPSIGHGPFPCRASGESLTDGRIYIRADGETREAKADEVDLLIQRGSVQQPIPVDFGVEVLGEVAPVELAAETSIDEYLMSVRNSLESALPRDRTGNQSSVEVAAATAERLSLMQSNLADLVTGLTDPEERSESEYRDSIDLWEANFRQRWDEAVPRIIGSCLSPVVVRITNRTTTFFHDVEVQLHLAGDILAVDYEDPKSSPTFSGLGLPRPPRKWGPRTRSFGGIFAHPNIYNSYIPSISPYIPSTISYTNGGSVTINLNVGELRPRGTFQSEQDEIVLVVMDQGLTTIKATWELTARDHNEVYGGEIALDVATPHDLTLVARQILGLATNGPEVEA
jgi:hypothetical protein